MSGYFSYIYDKSDVFKNLEFIANMYTKLFNWEGSIYWVIMNFEFRGVENGFVREYVLMGLKKILHWSN